MKPREQYESTLQRNLWRAGQNHGGRRARTPFAPLLAGAGRASGRQDATPWSEPARDGPSTRENPTLRRSVAAPGARRLLDGRGDGFFNTFERDASSTPTGYSFHAQNQCARDENEACLEISYRGDDAATAAACWTACADVDATAVVNVAKLGSDTSCCCLAACECFEDWVAGSFALLSDALEAPGTCGVDATGAWKEMIRRDVAAARRRPADADRRLQGIDDDGRADYYYVEQTTTTQGDHENNDACRDPLVNDDSTTDRDGYTCSSYRIPTAHATQDPIGAARGAGPKS